MNSRGSWLIGFFLLAGIIAGLVVASNWNHWNAGPAIQPAALDPDNSSAGSTSKIKPRHLPIISVCPDFEFADNSGATVNKNQLMGRALFIHFADSAAVSERFTQMESELSTKELSNDVRLLSIPLDQSGTKALQDALLASLSKDDQSALSDQIFLVDPQGELRNHYDTRQLKDITSLKSDLDLVLGERVLLVKALRYPNIPNDLMEPTWLARRKEEQLKTTGKFRVFHDFTFADRRQESGILYRNRVVDDAGRMIITAHYDHGNGVAVADVDGDQLLDIYFVNQVGSSQLWRNLGGGKFEDITEAAGVGLSDRIGVAASFADTDNDGDADLYVTTVRGGNALFENDGQGVFRDITKDAGLTYFGHSSGAVFFDYDRDGRVDLFLVNVGKYTTETEHVVVNDRYTGPDQTEHSYYISNPDAFAAHLKPNRVESSVLYHNISGNRFEPVSPQTKLIDISWTGDATAADLNSDGWPDLYLVCMQGHDEYYQNVEGKYFERKSREVFPATPWGSMGIKAFDFDNDGDLDIYVTDMHTDMAKDLTPDQEDTKIPKDAMDPSRMATDGNHVWGNAFFVNQGNGQFVESSDALGTENFWPWGFSVDDLNADGYNDIFVTASMSFPFRYATNRLLLNNRGEQFLSSEFLLGVEPRRDGRTAIPWFELDAAGKDYAHPVCELLRKKDIYLQRCVAWGALGSRSSVIFDIENDGDLDIVTLDFNAPPMVLISNLSEQNKSLHFLKIVLEGKQSNRDGLGAAVRVRAGSDTLMKVNDGKSGYLSHSRMPLYFGLGEHEAVDSIEVTWPSGKTQSVAAPIEMNSTIVVQEEG